MRRPPRFAQWLVGHAPASHAVRETIKGELNNEFRTRVGGMGERAAKRWFRRQAVSIVVRAWRDRLLGRRWGSGAEYASRGRPDALGIMRDARYALRILRKEPGFSATVVVTFALAVGANVAVFSVLESVLLRPLPYPAAGQLVHVHRAPGAVSYPDYVDWRQEATGASEFAAYRRTRETFVADDYAEEWVGVEGSSQLLRTLGVSPLMGPGFALGQPDIGANAIVLSHALWHSRFAGDENVIGTTVTFEGRTGTVTGVMPPGFYFPTPAEQFWAAFTPVRYMEQRGAWFLRTIARLSPGNTAESLEREISAIAARVDREHPSDSEPEELAVRVTTRREAFVGDTRPLMLLLIGAVSLVLAIASANLASLMLTRGIRRRREFAVRAALGAGRTRILRQVLVESVILAAIGGVLGTVVATGIVSALVALGPSDLPRREEIGVHGAALAYALVVTVVCGLLIGIIPAWRGRRVDAAGVLRGAAGATTGRRHHRLLGVLLIGQLAMTSVLLIGAGLLLNSLHRLVSVQPGFNVDRTMSLRYQLPATGYDSLSAILRFHQDVQARIATIPGVKNVGTTTGLPFTPSYTSVAYQAEGEDSQASRDMYIEIVSETYLEALGLPLLRGRLFEPGDGPEQPLVAIVNQDLVDRHWPNTDPIGRRFNWEPDEPNWITVVGVVPNVLRRGLHDTEGPVAYLLLPQFRGHYGFSSGRHGYVVVQADRDPSSLVETIARQARAIDPRVPISDVNTMRELVDASADEPRFRSVLVAVFALLALAVSVVGIYGAVAFNVTQRRREFGIRMALGAAHRRILGEVVARGALIVGCGLALGLVGALAATRLMKSMLFGITPTDPLTLGAALGLVGAVAVLATAVPARRASRVHPMVTLRNQ